MCFFFQQTVSALNLENRFNAKFDKIGLYQSSRYHGFQFPQTPVITNEQPDTIQSYQWGLIPFWAKDDSIKKNTLNARMETIQERPAFRNAVQNRCLILADGFYEWQWLDEKGKQKQQYLLTLPNNEPFAFAGLWSKWTDKSSGELIHSYTILTTEANTLMSKIHNSKKRMPVIVSADCERNWLSGEVLMMQNEKIVATEI